MQKHPGRRPRFPRDKRSSINANRLLEEACQEEILHLISGFSSEDQGDFSLSYLSEQYLSKYCDESMTPAHIRRSNAIDKWLETERRNAITNARLRGLSRNYNVLPRVSFYQFLTFAQNLTAKILGPLDDSIVLGTFSGGASTSRRRTQSHPASKFIGMADITEGAMPFVDVIHREAPLLRQDNIFTSLREVEGAVLFTVPKKTDIDRCACKEPDVNMFLQKGVGRHIRKRLLKFGVNLNDQSINRKLARQGSLDNSLATLDLSSASDSVTISAVQALLPHDWFLYLNDIRSQNVVVDGVTIRTEMFSSMGNGFTFELESLLFYVLMRSVSYYEGIPGVISVYGDDLIIPSRMHDMAWWILKLFGFELNQDKSFYDGPFRESCGGHYHSGIDVTPFYLKRKPTRLTDVIRVANQLRRWAMADPIRRYAMPSTYTMWSKLASYIPKDLWGGSDYDLDTQLVSPGSPTSKLVRVSKKANLSDHGKYLFWHCTNWNRSSEPDNKGHEPLSTDSICRKRRATLGTIVIRDEFFEEQFPDTIPG